MSLIQCSSDCLYQQDGYCGLDKAAEITDCKKAGGCLHYLPKRTEKGRKTASNNQSTMY